MHNVLQAIKAGRLEDAQSALAEFMSHPAQFSEQALAELQQARTLALIHRSRILQELRSLMASRLFEPATVPAEPHFRIDA